MSTTCFSDRLENGFEAWYKGASALLKNSVINAALNIESTSRSVDFIFLLVIWWDRLD